MTRRIITIKNRKIGKGQPTFVIAEAGVNHNGDLALAKELVRKAREAGADCVKFQTFVAENLVTDSAPKAKYQLKTTDPAESQFAMLKKLELKLEDYKELMGLCEELDIFFLSTPYNFRDVDFLESLGVWGYKLASMHLTELPMIQYVAKTGRPLFLATGMSTIQEIKDAVKIFEKNCNDKLILLQCTTNYPSRLEDVNLRVIGTMMNETNALVGYSDHTEGIEAAVLSVAAGAVVVEKHFTLDRDMRGPDQRSSSEPAEFTEMVKRIRQAEVIVGNEEKFVTEAEANNLTGMRRSLVATVEIPAGTVITANMLDFKRPATGLSPNLYHEVLGKRAKRNIPKNKLLSVEDID